MSLIVAGVLGCGGSAEASPTAESTTPPRAATVSTSAGSGMLRGGYRDPGGEVTWVFGYVSPNATDCQEQILTEMAVASPQRLNVIITNPNRELICEAACESSGQDPVCSSAIIVRVYDVASDQPRMRNVIRNMMHRI